MSPVALVTGWPFTIGRLVVIVGFAAVAVLLGARLVTRLFRAFDARSPEGDHEGLVAAATQLRGGTWIGMLERLAIFSALVVGFPEGIAICLAIKGLARYPELQATSSGAAERFIIGTFVSVLTACACAGLALWLGGPVLRWL